MPSMPPSSPDLSPIENYWAYMQRKMDVRGCSTFTEFKEALTEEARSTHPAVFSNLVGSMKRRLDACIKRGGGKTSY